MASLSLNAASSLENATTSWLTPALGHEVDRRAEVAPVYFSDLNGSSTRYDRMIAGPSDDARNLMWSLWASITTFGVLVTSVVFVAILRSPKARRNAFNLYLLAIILPDTFFSFSCAITCLTNRLAEAYTSQWMCQFQAFYFTIGVSADAYMNAIVARELYNMLESSQRFRRHRPPSARKVLVQSLCVYGFALALGCLVFVNRFLPWFPFKARLMIGVACLPVEYNVYSTLFFYLVYMPVVVICPMLYVAWIFFLILRNKLVPPPGKRRIIFICFLQLILVFLVMWLPAALLIFVNVQWINPWVKWLGGTLTHMQGPFSVMVLATKPDVGRAVTDLFGVTTPSDDDNDDSDDFFALGVFWRSVKQMRRGSLDFRSSSLKLANQAIEGLDLHEGRIEIDFEEVARIEAKAKTDETLNDVESF